MPMRTRLSISYFWADENLRGSGYGCATHFEICKARSPPEVISADVPNEMGTINRHGFCCEFDDIPESFYALRRSTSVERTSIKISDEREIFAMHSKIEHVWVKPIVLKCKLLCWWDTEASMLPSYWEHSQIRVVAVRSAKKYLHLMTENIFNKCLLEWCLKYASIIMKKCHWRGLLSITMEMDESAYTMKMN